MGIAERKIRDRRSRERLIISTARSIAEVDGWDAVTIRRLASEIEHSQPVLYAHFANRDAIVAAVALEGFRELSQRIGNAASGSHERECAPAELAKAYLAFARNNPALYEAMFTAPTELRFAAENGTPELKECFASLSMLAPSTADVAVATETFWAGLHGLAELERTGRIRRDARDERVEFLVHSLIG